MLLGVCATSCGTAASIRLVCTDNTVCLSAAGDAGVVDSGFSSTHTLHLLLLLLQGALDCLQQIQQYISTQPPSEALQHIQQMAQSGLHAAGQEEQKLSLLLQESRAVQLQEPVPQAVAEARRRTMQAWEQQRS